jgi:hypothetical protein
VPQSPSQSRSCARVRCRILQSTPDQFPATRTRSPALGLQWRCRADGERRSSRCCPPGRRKDSKRSGVPYASWSPSANRPALGRADAQSYLSIVKSLGGVVNKVLRGNTYVLLAGLVDRLAFHGFLALLGDDCGSDDAGCESGENFAMSDFEQIGAGSSGRLVDQRKDRAAHEPPQPGALERHHGRRAGRSIGRAGRRRSQEGSVPRTRTFPATPRIRPRIRQNEGDAKALSFRLLAISDFHTWLVLSVQSRSLPSRTREQCGAASFGSLRGRGVGGRTRGGRAAIGSELSDRMLILPGDISGGDDDSQIQGGQPGRPGLRLIRCSGSSAKPCHNLASAS